MSVKQHWNATLAFALWVCVGIVLVGCDQTDLSRLSRVLDVLDPHRITLRVTDYCPVTGNKPVDFYAENFSYRFQRGQMLLDSDADGVPDLYDNDTTFDLSPDNADTSGLGYGDLYMFRMGVITADQQLLRLCPDKTEDSDNDGLTDCTEKTLGTDSFQWDSAGAGIPDGLAFRAGINPLDGSEAFLDSSGDGWNNLKKIHANLPIDEPVSAYQKFAVSVQQETTPSNPVGCFNYVVYPLPIVPTLDNHVMLYFIEQNPQGNQILRTGLVIMPGSTPDGTVFEKKFADFGV